ncbi:MAG: methyltransferase domain-containing protein [Acidimicrobiia bacterium]
MSSNWDDLTDWWFREVENDQAYASDVHPILLELLPDDLGVAMDLGCGEGQGMRTGGDGVFGCDLSLGLLRRSEANGRVVQTRLPNLRWLGDSVLETAYSVYLLDLIEDHDGFFAETARAVTSGGSLVIVINHPVYTAPGSAPLMDADEEVLWRWGTYFTEGSSTEPAGEGSVEFFHRPMSELLSSAASHGWVLDRLMERGLSAETIARIPFYEGQEHIPRLLGVRWSLG